MALRYLLPLLAIASCGPPPDCITPTLKLQVYGNQVACSDYERSANAFWRTFSTLGRIDARFTSIDETVTGYRIDAKRDNWACGPRGCFAGQTYCHMRSIDVNETYVPAGGVLIHELVHAAQGCIAWPLEGGDPYPGGDRVEYGHEGWMEHQIFEYIDHAERAK